MTIYEIRLIAVLGLLAVGAIALVASLAVVHLQGLLRHPNNMAVPSPALRDVARLANRRRAA
jgi:hypothetical protein